MDRSDQTTIESLLAGRNAILYNPERLPAVSLEWLQPQFWRLRQAVSAELGGRGQALAVETEAGPAVLRRFYRGGWVARYLHDRYLFTGVERSRSWREYRVLKQLFEAGLPVPEPLAASCERIGLAWYRAGLLTARVPGAVTLAECARYLDDQDWRRLGRTLSRFFRAGLRHPDLNAHNILLDEGRSWYVIDFDRAWIQDRPSFARPMIDRLFRSFERLGLRVDRQRLDIEPR
ncbi:3-deoxy-D-manno-octulosonic acid kinase [Wenzhouxiangella marina]|uniref:3-deoxy-D-manno-octulosonic acid kinase n=2 Tax=Wenzhouxiangella marina TaxID=1579979 RepID=A0A0K0XUW4_9GAMM|nr:3-deoxy-D-manno-octulosonic acid kinase [Wenzhouxiangella marina]AKS41473.1 3-deoxy-D-manno-octulosonic acid kinase [Wenzhouxiangella marina]